MSVLLESRLDNDGRVEGRREGKRKVVIKGSEEVSSSMDRTKRSVIESKSFISFAPR
jgi:hypothetical protein